MPSDKLWSIDYAGGKNKSNNPLTFFFWKPLDQVQKRWCFFANQKLNLEQEFLDWLLQQRRGQVTVNNIAERDDVTEATRISLSAKENVRRSSAKLLAKLRSKQKRSKQNLAEMMMKNVIMMDT